MKSTIQAIQLLSGQWIIAKVIDDSPMALTVSMPAIPMMEPQPNGTQTLTFMPYAPLIKDQKKIPLSKSLIYMYGVADEKMSGFYQQATGDIVTPTKGLIVPGK